MTSWNIFRSQYKGSGKSQAELSALYKKKKAAGVIPGMLTLKKKGMMAIKPSACPPCPPCPPYVQRRQQDDLHPLLYQFQPRTPRKKLEQLKQQNKKNIYKYNNKKLTNQPEDIFYDSEESLL